MAIASKAEILRAGREREKRQKRISRLIGCFVILVLVMTFVGLLNFPFLRVTNINLLGETSADKEVVQQFVRDQITGRHLWLIPKDSIFFVSKNKITENLQNNFPGLARVEISWPDLNTISIFVVDRESKVLWCTGEKEAKQCYYLSPEGFAYQLAPNFSNSLFVELHNTLAPKKINQQVIDIKNLKRVTSFLNYIKSSLPSWPCKGLQLKQAEVLPQNDFEIILIKPSDPDWQAKIIFNTEQKVENLIINLHSVLKNKNFQQEWQTAGGKLDYLDLRFNGKVFYKFKI